MKSGQMSRQSLRPLKRFKVGFNILPNDLYRADHRFTHIEGSYSLFRFLTLHFPRGPVYLRDNWIELMGRRQPV